ncbi:hypothetical protein CAOG_03416 [Capsaspora owczarzaki ATCC 30864]|uniref:hypothetical protein n=1 Tax=Capsaspora owczarzaki (strain ATCC 30864) TaxID=595528 RepID=UPI000352587C|nr:hypothetical protein CAOG_03416 [Capsaspora owczarzaki ATCC 30864]|eukprot:XP_004364255.2 hypothetical protein CAOG_03416 [Capsaspora owczarzaki ATCC 30864]
MTSIGASPFALPPTSATSAYHPSPVPMHTTPSPAGGFQSHPLAPMPKQSSSSSSLPTSAPSSSHSHAAMRNSVEILAAAAAAVSSSSSANGNRAIIQPQAAPSASSSLMPTVYSQKPIGVVAADTSAQYAQSATSAADWHRNAAAAAPLAKPPTNAVPESALAASSLQNTAATAGLSSGGVPAPSANIQIRRERNAISARKSRDKKREYVKVLEERLTVLAKAHAEMAAFLQTLPAELGVHLQPFAQPGQVAVVEEAMALAALVLQQQGAGLDSTMLAQFGPVQQPQQPQQQLQETRPNNTQLSTVLTSLDAALDAANARISKRAARFSFQEKRDRRRKASMLLEALALHQVDLGLAPAHSRSKRSSSDSDESGASGSDQDDLHHDNHGDNNNSNSNGNSNSNIRAGSDSASSCASSVSGDDHTTASKLSPRSSWSSSSEDDGSRHGNSLDFRQWSSREVAEYLERCGHADVATRFLQEEISGEVLSMLQVGYFTQAPLGLTLGKACKLYECFQQLIKTN